MTIQSINHQGFRYCGEVETRKELDSGIEWIKDCLVVLFVVALTAVFVISFAAL